MAYTPLSRPLFVYVNAESLQRPEVQEFMKFYIATARELVADVGYVEFANRDIRGRSGEAGSGNRWHGHASSLDESLSSWRAASDSGAARHMRSEVRFNTHGEC